MSKLPSKPRQSANVLDDSKPTFGRRTLPGRLATKDETIISSFGARLPENLKTAGAALAKSGIRDVLTNQQTRALSDQGRSGIARPQNSSEATNGKSDPRNANLPAIISRALVECEESFNPNWHMVRNLPGYFQQAIRGYGRTLFGEFTSAPLEEIQTLTTLSNSETEVKLMMAWIKENGVQEDIAEVDGAQVFGQYKADVQKWSCMDFSFLLVRDQAGYYVYGWHRDFDNSIDNEPRPCLPGR